MKKTPKETIKLKKRFTVRICGRCYTLIFDPKRNGGEFSTMAADGKSGGYIVVGTQCGDLNHIFEVLFHEIVEATLAVDNRRWKDEGNNANPLMFVFDHAYLDEFCAKVIDSLVSSGCMELGEKACS